MLVAVDVEGGVVSVFGGGVCWVFLLVKGCRLDVWALGSVVVWCRGGGSLGRFWGRFFPCWFFKENLY